MSSKSKRSKLLAIFLQKLEILTEESLVSIFGFLQHNLQTNLHQQTNQHSLQDLSDHGQTPHPNRNQQNTCGHCSCNQPTQATLSTIDLNGSSELDLTAQLKKILQEFSRYTKSLTILSKELEMIYDVSLRSRFGDNIFSSITDFIEGVADQTGAKEEVKRNLESFRLNLQDFEYISTYNQRRMDQITNMIEYEIELAQNSIKSFEKKLTKHGLASPIVESRMSQNESPRENIVATQRANRRYSLSEKGQSRNQSGSSKESASHNQQEVNSEQSQLSEGVKKRQFS